MALFRCSTTPAQVEQLNAQTTMTISSTTLNTTLLVPLTSGEHIGVGITGMAVRVQSGSNSFVNLTVEDLEITTINGTDYCEIPLKGSLTSENTITLSIVVLLLHVYK